MSDEEEAGGFGGAEESEEEDLDAGGFEGADEEDETSTPRCSMKCNATRDAREGTFNGHAHVDPEAGTLTGIGSFTCEDGYMFTGEWKDSLPHGDGVEMNSEGTETSGKWTDGVLIDVDRSRSLQQVFKDGPAEQVEALRSAGLFTMTKFGFWTWWVCHLTLGAYAVSVAFLNWPAKQGIDGGAYTAAVAMMCIYLLQLVIYTFFTWRDLRSPVSSPPLFYITFGAKVTLLLALLLIAAITLMAGTFEGEQNLPLQKTAKMLLVLANMEGLIMFFVIGIRHMVYRLTPWEIRERRAKAQKAYADGITDYVDSNAAGIQKPFVAAHLCFLGLAFLVWRLNFIVNILPERLAAENTTTADDGSGQGSVAFMNAENAAFVNFDFIGVACYASCFCGGIILAATKKIPSCANAKPGHVPTRDMFVGACTFITIGSMGVAAHMVGIVKLLRPDTELKHTEGLGAAVLFAWTWWFTVVLAVVLGQLLKSLNAGAKYVSDDEKEYARLWASLQQNDIKSLSKTTDKIKKLRSGSASPVHRYPHTTSRFGNFVEIYRRIRLLNPLIDEKSKEWFEILTDQYGDNMCVRMPGPLKTYRRAIDKIWRSYDGNVDQLVDVARTAIVCHSLKQVAFLTETFLADKDVSIKRCKNRFHPSYDPSVTAGYRDVAFNMRLKSANAIELGLDGMVFEVQLLIKSVYDVKVGAGHANYNILRSLAVN